MIRFRYYKGVRYVAPNKPAPATFARCGHCGRAWDDDKPTGLTPTPAGRCPFEYWHRYKQERPRPREYQPKTGAPCNCRPGMQRDNCPACEGTGWRIDFAAIRSRQCTG